jgi:hypothetical protein
MNYYPLMCKAEAGHRWTEYALYSSLSSAQAGVRDRRVPTQLASSLIRDILTCGEPPRVVMVVVRQPAPRSGSVFSLSVMEWCVAAALRCSLTWWGGSFGAPRSGFYRIIVGTGHPRRFRRLHQSVNVGGCRGKLRFVVVVGRSIIHLKWVVPRHMLVSSQSNRSCGWWVFLELHSATDIYNTHVQLPLWTHIHKPYFYEPYFYEFLWRTEHLVDMKIPEVIISVSLSMRMPLTT